MLRYGCVVALLLLGACGYGPYIPPKEARYDETAGQIALPNCPDWRSPSDSNYNNTNHSNFGCATSNNIAVQLQDPRDLAHGHGTAGPDAEISNRVMDDYRSGKIPTPLQPTQSSGGQ